MTLNYAEKKVLQFLFKQFSTQGFPPSYREICDGCGIGSTSHVHKCIHSLKGKGLVDWVPRTSRTLHLTKQGRQFMGAIA